MAISQFDNMQMHLLNGPVKINHKDRLAKVTIASFESFNGLTEPLTIIFLQKRLFSTLIWMKKESQYHMGLSNFKI